MAKIANTFVSTSAVGNKEQLSDVVSRITPEDTPIYSMLKTEKAKGTHPEWQIDDLAAPGENAQSEGDSFGYDAITPPERVGNYTQIMRKTWIVSDTQEAVDNAGQVEKVKYQKLKKGIEIKKDMEYMLVSNQGSVAGETRKSGSLASWYETNANRGTGGANGGFNTSTGLTEAATNGTQRAFTKALLDDTMQQCYNAGGNVKFAVVSPYVKSVFTTFMSDANVAQFRYAATGGKNTIVATADVYEGPFGKVMIVPNRVMSQNATVARNVHLLDRSMISLQMLRKIAPVKGLSKDSDATKGVILGEGTLKVKNEAGIGVVADVFGLTATT